MKRSLYVSVIFIFSILLLTFSASATEDTFPDGTIGAVYTETDSKPFSTYEEMADLLNEHGGTARLFESIDGEYELTLTKDAEIDLCGCVFGDVTLDIYAKITISDSSKRAEGKLIGSGVTSGYKIGGICLFNGSELTLKSGELLSKVSFMRSEASFTVEGGLYNGEIYYYDEGTVRITGGDHGYVYINIDPRVRDFDILLSGGRFDALKSKGADLDSLLAENALLKVKDNTSPSQNELSDVEILMHENHSYDTHGYDATHHWPICSVCNEPDPTVVKAEHNMLGATCTVKSRCLVCDMESGELADHSYKGGNCTVCGAEDPNYFPVGAIIAITAAVVCALSAVVTALIVKKKRS